MNYQLHLGDCLSVMRTLPAGSVQTCVTSPPYFGLRDYGHEGQIGLEQTPDAYVAKLVEVFREVRRVLHPSGTLWCNLGDSYATGTTAPRQQGSRGIGDATQAAQDAVPRIGNPFGCKTKDLIGIPWMVAFALRADGWWLRSDIIWSKPNPMPESVTDRPTKAHEYIFLLSKSASYFYDAEAVVERASMDSGFSKQRLKGVANWAHREGIDVNGGNQGNNKVWTDTATRNRRSVWTVTTKPYAGAHFATFPPDLIEPCILAGTSAHGACAKCGAPWARVVEKGGMYWDGPTTRATDDWQPTCTCGCTDVVPCTVLDPFCGSGTTLAVALKHNRRGIGIELNESYISLAHDRIRKSQPMLLAAL